jgi:hypothetical protein
MKHILTITFILAIILNVIAALPSTGRDIQPSSAAPATTAQAERVATVATNAAPDPMSDAEKWRKDPICQMVFFAILEGLYTDGVPSEAVDLIVPPKTDLDTNVKHSFVFRCPLCHAAYEAFILYQRRQAFHGSEEKASTFATNRFDKKLMQGLSSSSIRTRVYTMGAMVQPWIDRRIKMMNLTPAGKTNLMNKFLAYAKDGNNKFRKLRGDRDSIYFQWQFYGGCQACQAAINIAKEMNIKTNKGH